MIIYKTKQVEQELIWWLKYLRRTKQYDQVRYLEGLFQAMSLPGSTILVIDEYRHSEKVMLTITEEWFDKKDGRVKSKPSEKMVSREYIIVYHHQRYGSDGNLVTPEIYSASYEGARQGMNPMPINGALYNHCLNRNTDRLEPWNSNWGIHT